jgi:hypothetical protein
MLRRIFLAVLVLVLTNHSLSAGVHPRDDGRAPRIHPSHHTVMKHGGASKVRSSTHHETPRHAAHQDHLHIAGTPTNTVPGHAHRKDTNRRSEQEHAAEQRVRVEFRDRLHRLDAHEDRLERDRNQLRRQEHDALRLVPRGEEKKEIRAQYDHLGHELSEQIHQRERHMRDVRQQEQAELRKIRQEYQAPIKPIEWVERQSNSR